MDDTLTTTDWSTPTKLLTEAWGLELALNALVHAQMQRDRAKEGLERAKTTLILSGNITGKNAEEREASTRSALAAEYGALFEAEQALTKAKSEVAIARLRWDTCIALLPWRLDERTGMEESSCG